ncbi:MAG: imidazolonepropionase [Proteobacteria bacterium]|nr:imidazolonepropionase [Pseudomonadota bacterium]TDJ33705.1 MAG: imidazolonepropionase [Gammaproteobacteria bacterium]
MQDWDLLLTDMHLASMTEGGAAYGIVEDGALAISGGKIAWVGPASEVPASGSRETRSLEGRWLTPALIDCHTHLVFAGNRAAEFEQRLLGVSYEDIARAGGGIMSTVNPTRDASNDELLSSGLARLNALMREGVATVEIKSGYGLNVETELRMLEVIRTLAANAGLSIRSTFLGAHAVPGEYKGRSGDYIDLVCDEMLPAAHEAQLADAVDAYCESIAFSTDEVARVFDTANSLGIPVKLHADQFSDGGGAALAAGFDALSADHLEFTSIEGVKSMADAGTAAVLLPGAFLTLGETQLPPIDALRDSEVRIAIATDCNPGTSPVCSLRVVMNLASSLFYMTPEECLAGVTRNAAHALGLEQDRGTLEVGKRADIAVWDIGHPRELTYWMGLNQLAELLVAGQAAGQL